MTNRRLRNALENAGLGKRNGYKAARKGQQGAMTGDPIARMILGNGEQCAGLEDDQISGITMPNLQDTEGKIVDQKEI